VANKGGAHHVVISVHQGLSQILLQPNWCGLSFVWIFIECSGNRRRDYSCSGSCPSVEFSCAHRYRDVALHPCSGGILRNGNSFCHRNSLSWNGGYCPARDRSRCRRSGWRPPLKSARGPAIIRVWLWRFSLWVSEHMALLVGALMKQAFGMIPSMICESLSIIVSNVES
jgi:hypothetical protein